MYVSAFLSTNYHSGASGYNPYIFKGKFRLCVLVLFVESWKGAGVTSFRACVILALQWTLRTTVRVNDAVKHFLCLRVSRMRIRL